jgi:site-specific DNA-cytosine methylase
MKYISLFSGIGGLEHPSVKPIIFCELDRACYRVLRRLSPSAEIVPDVVQFSPPKADLVVGGFPCQDLSVAGKREGLRGANSGLFFQMTRVAREAKASHLVIENVPNLLRLGGGASMRAVLNELRSDWPFISWRTLNARQFGLPQQRTRVMVVASKSRESTLGLFRHIPEKAGAVLANPTAAGFYTTAGTRSICYSIGFVPTLKVGSSVGIPTPPGLHIGASVRKASAAECIAFQGFPLDIFKDVPDKDIFRQMGNAVPLPMGHFALSSVTTCENVSLKECESIEANGFYDGRLWLPLGLSNGSLATNLELFLSESSSSLSQRAASGLVRRLKRSGTRCPPSLLARLQDLASGGTSVDLRA